MQKIKVLFYMLKVRNAEILIENFQEYISPHVMLSSLL